MSRSRSSVALSSDVRNCPSPCWPGLTPAGTLLLPLRREDFLAGDGPLSLDGTRFEPKRELHVTLLGTAAGAHVRGALDGGRCVEANLAAAFARQPWIVGRTGRYAWLRKLKSTVDPSGAPRDQLAEAIVEWLDLPAMAAFRRELGALLGAPLPEAPPHVTLFVAGDATGIGLPDHDTLARCFVRDVSPEALAGRVI